MKLKILSILLILTTLCSVFASCVGPVIEDDPEDENADNDILEDEDSDDEFESDSDGSSDTQSDDTESDSNADSSTDENSESESDSEFNDESESKATEGTDEFEKDALPIFADNNYSVQFIRKDTANTVELNVYNQIRSLFKGKTSKIPALRTDFVASGKEPYDGPAILIGDTSYQESKDAYKKLKDGEASATLVGDKYVIAYTTEESIEHLLASLEFLVSRKAEKQNIKINKDWEISINDGTKKMTKTQWLNQYKSTLSERDMALLTRAYEVLEGNTIQSDDHPWGSSPTISPWVGSTAGIWNWDSVFHAMTVCRYDGELAKSCIDSIAKFQKENGLIPDVVYPDGRIADNYSKPPVFAWGVLEVYKELNDIDFLRRNYDCSVKYESFWRNYRFDNGLFFYSAQENPEKDDYLHPRWESGWDNSPRWDFAPIVDLYPIDLNCYMVLYYRSLAEMADILGIDGSEWKTREKALTTQIETRLYSETLGAYVDRNRKTGEYSNVLSPASFMPLFIGTASQKRAESMNKIARDKTKFYPGMPSVSYDNEGYNNDYWRGPTWLNIAFFAVKGLDDYGYTQTADEIKEFLLNMCYNGLPYIYENYDTKTQTGKSHNLFSWSSAFIIEFILQFEEKDQK